MNSINRSFATAILLAAGFCGMTSAATAAGVSGQGTWEASLLARDFAGNGAGIDAYYDSVLDLTWLRDANLAKTSGVDTDGFMSFTEANDWAASLSLFGGENWRLPAVTPVNGGSFNETFTNNGSSDVGYSAVGRAWGTHSELGYMSYVHLGNPGFYISDDENPERFGLEGTVLVNPAWQGLDGLNPGPFVNVAERPAGVGLVPYWTSTPFFEDAWYLEFNYGLQWYFDFGFDVPGAGLAWAVHDGDLIGPAVVPVPPALPLFGGALAAMLAWARRSRRPQVQRPQAQDIHDLSK